ncbi:MAG: hypothetical protein GEU79_00780 [Acidimicrobiia bacterium]|nr:hypothetical protein [Acidimicrobiia bacterium]
MDESANALKQAQEAHARRDWPTAATYYSTVAADQFTADDFSAYFYSVWWLGRSDDALRLGAAAFDALRIDSQLAEAAKVACLIALLHISRGDKALAFGWAGRAGRALEGIPENPGHGYLSFLIGVQMKLMTGEPAAAVDAARQVQNIGREFGDPDLVAAGLYGQGHGMIKLGQVPDGLGLLDESMVSVLDGRAATVAAGALYCWNIAACHEVAELGRMTRWTELAERWLASQTAAFWYGGICRVYRAELQLLRGEWEDAERGARQIAVEFDGNMVRYAAAAWYVVGEVRRLRGDPTAADAYHQAHARGHDPQPGRALLMLQRGDAEGAATSVRTALAAAGTDPLRRAPICAAAVEIALAAERLDLAAEAESELAETAATYGTSGLEAMATTARGALLLTEGRAEEALAVLRDGCRHWLDLGAEYDAARTCRWLAKAYRALGDEASAAAEDARADETHERLKTQQSEPEISDVLTGRECEVLALVAEGRSNRQIGEDLFISDRTVARHLTNIFHKLGVANRTEAARYAVDHGITTSS